MKAIKSIYIVLLFSVSSLFAAKPPSSPSKKITAEVQVFFTPRQIKEMNAELHKLLDSAKQQVLVAMYWITDDKIIDKLIEIKKKKINVQVIFDESTPNAHELESEFQKSGIEVKVVPSEKYPYLGRMHHKFIVIDSKIVWTGSGNFTKAAIDPNSLKTNFENFIIFDATNTTNKDITRTVRKYNAKFNQMIKFDIDQQVTKAIEIEQQQSQYSPKKLYYEPSTQPSTPGEEDYPQEGSSSSQEGYDDDFLSSFEYTPSPVYPTPNQKRLLRRLGATEDQIQSITTNEEVSQLIDELEELKEQERRQRYRQQQRSSYYKQPYQGRRKRR